MAASPSQAGGEDRRGAALTLSLMWASLRGDARLPLAFRIPALEGFASKAWSGGLQ